MFFKSSDLKLCDSERQGYFAKYKFFLSFVGCCEWENNAAFGF